MAVPPRSVRSKVLNDYLVGLPMDKSTKASLANNEHLAPAVVERAAKVLKAVHAENPSINVDKALERIVGNTLSAHRLADISLERPDLFVYSCLGADGLHSLKAGMTVFKDKRTQITILSLQPLRIDRNKIAYRIDPAFVHFAEDPLKEHDYDAVLLEVEVCSVTLGTSDRFPVLYMAMENINCFDEVMSKGWFSVDYLCATREGLAMGACGKSILSHVYTEGRNLTHRFHPRFVITWGDYTDSLFRNGAKRYYPELRKVAHYIPENLGAHDHHLYECYPG